AGDYAGLPCGGNRIGRLQRAVVLTCRSCPDHGGRSRPRPCGAQSPQACGGAPVTDMAILLPVLLQSGRGGACHFLLSLPPAEPLDYWEGRGLFGRRRISMFSRNVYRFGLLGCSIGFGHLLARLHGVDLSEMLHACSLAEQRAFFETSLAPLFDKPLVRWATGRQMSLYGLGIPPAQYAALGAGAPNMATVLRDRVERLSCDFSLDDNYFAWQAFGRSYSDRATGPLPPYLKQAHF